MNSFYFEICISPSNFSDIFVSEISDFTNEAIEIDKDKIIIRTSKNISKDLINYLDVLSANLSLINDKEVSFTHTITKKETFDYIQKYKDSIQGIICGAFYIYPPWENANNSKINIILEPSLAFGTGHHESTFMCIESLSFCGISSNTSLLDVGCGSGILALCANKLGAKVSMCDIDEDAILEAKKNFLRNNATITNIWHGQISDLKSKDCQKYDIVVSNIVASVIVLESPNLISLLNNKAYLILSGILDKYVDWVKDNFKTLNLIEQKVKNEWICLKYQN